MPTISRRDAMRLSALGILPLGPLVATGLGEAPASTSEVYDLVFEGGGAKGCAFVGALDVLLDTGTKRRLGRLVGSSAGAITATFLAVGYTPREMLKILREDATGGPDPNHPRADGKEGPPRRMAKLMDWARTEDVKGLISGSDTLKAFREETRTARQLMIEQLEGAAAKEDEHRKALSGLAKASSFTKSKAWRGLAAGLGFTDNQMLEDIISESMLVALLHNPRIAPAFAFLETGGFLLGREFLTWLGEKLEAKGVKATDTLKDLYEKTGKESGRELSIIASDTTDSEMLVLNHRTAPGCPVVQAVRMSMSIPFVFREVAWERDWGHYMGREKTGNIIVDGGMLSNFPIGLLQSPPALPEFLLKEVRDAANRDKARVDVARAIMGEPPGDPGRASIVGLLIDETLDVPGAKPLKKGPEVFRQSVDRTNRIVNTVTGTWDVAAVTQFKDRICRLPAKGYDVLEFGMEDDRLDPLLKAAGEAMTAFLTKG